MYEDKQPWYFNFVRRDIAALLPPRAERVLEVGCCAGRHAAMAARRRPGGGLNGSAAMLPWIDALRGLAILMVLANHVALVMPGLSAPVLALARFGQMGVQLFFVASAFTLCLSWQQRRQDEPQPVQRFLLRRFFRIAPLYFLGIAVFAGLHFSQPGAVAAAPYTTGNVMANVLFVHGFVPAAQNSVVPGGWSIGVEMAFYALFPWLMWMQAALPARFPVLPATLLCAAAALALNLGMQAATAGVVANNSAAYFHPLNQLPVFLIGMALFEWQRHAAPRLWLVGTFGVIALLATALLWRSSLALAFALVPTTAGLAFAALACIASRLPLRWGAGLPARLCAVGRLSFAIYVIHVLFAWHALRPLALAGGWQGDPAYLGALAAVTLLSCGAAMGLARWIERPGIALGRALIRAWPSAAPVRAR